MSTAVLETPVADPIYKMPACKPGHEILYYPDCAESEPGHLGWISKVGEKAVEILVLGPTIRPMRYVKHITDPQRLTQNFRHNGSWAFRPSVFEIENLKSRSDELDKIIAALTAQVAELTDALTSGKKGK